MDAVMQQEEKPGTVASIQEDPVVWLLCLRQAKLQLKSHPCSAAASAPSCTHLLTDTLSEHSHNKPWHKSHLLRPTGPPMYAVYTGQWIALRGFELWVNGSTTMQSLSKSSKHHPAWVGASECGDSGLVAVVINKCLTFRGWCSKKLFTLHFRV